MRAASKYILFVVPIAFSLSACGQSPSSASANSPTSANGTSRGADYFRQYTQADDLAKKEKFAEAAALYERLTQIYPDDAEIWIKLGRARSQSKQFRAAADALSRAAALGGEYPGSLAFRIARNYALAGDKEQALAWLAKSLAIPLEFRPRIADDDAFAALRNDEAFRKLAGLEPKGTFTREQEWNYDLDFLVAEIRRMHYAYRGHPVSADFEGDVRRLRQRIAQLPNAAMIIEVQHLLARLGDGHTGLQQLPSELIPVAFYDFSDGYFITDAPSDCACIGDRLLAIGSTPIATAVEKITPFLSVDNAMGVRQKAPTYLRFPDYLRAAGIASGKDVTLSLEGAHGKRQYTAKASDDFSSLGRLFPSKLSTAGPVPRYLQHGNDNYTVETMPDGNTVYFQFNQVFDEQGESIEQFAVKLRAALAPSRIRNLIIDVRHNTGGNLNLFTPLLRAIIAFEVAHQGEVAHEGAGVYVLTSRRTFSAAQVFVNELDHYTSAIVAGEPSGSKPNFIGESAPTKLPFSGLDMTISTRYHQTDDQDSRTWIAPKIPVALSSKDYFANRDPVMEAVLEVIRERAK